MANRDTPSGLKPAFHLAGKKIRPQKYTIASGYNTSIFSGDLVKQTSTSKGIQIATTGNKMVGVFAGCEYTDLAGNQIFSRFWLADTDCLNTVAAVAYVYDDPDIVWQIQTDSASAFAITDIGLLLDLVKTHSGVAATGQSRMEVNQDVSTQDDFMIYGIVDREDNAVGIHADIHVLINKHAYHNAGAARVASV